MRSHHTVVGGCMHNNVVFYLQKGQVQGFVKAEKPRLLPCRESLWWVEIGAQARDFLRSSLNFAAPAAGGRAGPPNDNHGVVDRGPTTTRGTPASPTSLTSIFRLEAALCAGYPQPRFSTSSSPNNPPTASRKPRPVIKLTRPPCLSWDSAVLSPPRQRRLPPSRPR